MGDDLSACGCVDAGADVGIFFEYVLEEDAAFLFVEFGGELFRHAGIEHFLDFDFNGDAMRKSLFSGTFQWIKATTSTRCPQLGGRD